MDADAYTLQIAILAWLNSHAKAEGHSLYSKDFFSGINDDYPCSEREFVLSLRTLCEQRLILCYTDKGSILHPRDSMLLMTVLGLTVAGREELRVAKPSL